MKVLLAGKFLNFTGNMVTLLPGKIPEQMPLKHPHLNANRKVMNAFYPISFLKGALRRSTWIIALMGCLTALLLGSWQPAQALQQPAEVRHVGVSRVGEQTLLTVILTRPAAPLIAQRTVDGVPRMVIDFPQAGAGNLPDYQGGDEILVRRVLTQVAPSGRGVQITLEMDPNRPYTWWRQSRPLKGGQTAFIMGFQAAGAPSPAQLLPTPPPEPSTDLEERVPEPSPEPQWTPPPSGPRPVGGFAELRSLAPQAASLWQFLEKDGWAVAESKDYDRPGKRFSRGFTLTNARYHEAVINIAHIPANTPGAPDINVIDLDFSRLNSDAAKKYRELKKWDFGKIKQDYEDIGDFFDDALKPLRVKLRQECQSLAQRWQNLIREFVRHAAPQRPQAAEEVVTHINAKVNPRFEGVQFTIAERPLLILNLVDFLYIRAYYLGTGTGG